SLGCTLYYLLTGRAMYAGANAMEVMTAHLDSPIPSLAAGRAGVPPALNAIFLRMVAKKPADRFASMQALLAELEPLAQTLGSDKPSRSLGDLALVAGQRLASAFRRTHISAA